MGVLSTGPTGASPGVATPGLTPTRLHRLPHVAVLVLLAALARARLVAADLLAAVADRLGLLVAPLTAGDRLLLLVLDAALLRQHALRLLVRRRPDRPHPLLEALLLLHAEHGVT